jgi:hypothetical protein
MNRAFPMAPGVRRRKAMLPQRGALDQAPSVSFSHSLTPSNNLLPLRNLSGRLHRGVLARNTLLLVSRQMCLFAQGLWL